MAELREGRLRCQEPGVSTVTCSRDGLANSLLAPDVAREGSARGEEHSGDSPLPKLCPPAAPR